ncbi:MAG TPA: hypothetical protein VOB72_10485 [Candidatus Dormibacteraeota bacterium]|nr:hypothetical protein [Candidatus Dormibacteraeota bacterium]
MSANFEQSHHRHHLTRATHRVALELEVDRSGCAFDPEDWDLEQLIVALNTGQARPLRTIRGLVVDAERDRMSSMLDAVADDLDETTELQWLASASKHPAVSRAAARRPRPSLATLVDLQGLAAWARMLARELDRDGM